MRDFLNKYGPHVIGGILVVALLYYIFFVSGWGETRTGNPTLAFFVDEETGAESVHQKEELPPLNNAEGKPTLVRAFKFSCDNGRTSQTMYLQKYTPEAAAQLNSMAADDPKRSMVMTEGELLRDPKSGSPWVSATSEEGGKLLLLPDCPNHKPMVMVSPR